MQRNIQWWNIFEWNISFLLSISLVFWESIDSLHICWITKFHWRFRNSSRTLKLITKKFNRITWKTSIFNFSRQKMFAIQFKSYLSVKSSLKAIQQFTILFFFQIQNIKKKVFLFKFKFILRREVEWRKWAIKFRTKIIDSQREHSTLDSSSIHRSFDSSSLTEF